jgi:nucleotide-binding universal stress UspA family protein
MRERLVVALDGSKEGESTLPYVQDLLSKLLPEVEKEVILLRVVPHVTIYVQAEGASVPNVAATEKEMERNRKEALEYLEKTMAALTVKDVRVRCEVAVGDASQEIVRTSDEMDADLIAMSTHGRSGLSRWAFGSVTDKVLRLKSKTPVVVVRALGEHPA